MAMSEQDNGRNQVSRVLKAAPVTPSAESHRPDGLAFDIEDGADLPGVPVGDQRPASPDADNAAREIHESGQGVGLAVPGTRQNSQGTTGGE